MPNGNEPRDSLFVCFFDLTVYYKYLSPNLDFTSLT